MMPGENENILIRVVDDDAHMRGSLEFMLTAEGFAVKTYPSAQAFLTDDAPSRPGCLILDVKMDGMTGLELQEEMIRRGIRLGGISVKTVQVHRSEINRKLGVKGVVELTEAVNRIRALLGDTAA